MANWTTTAADRCEASGGWSGIKDPNGSELVGPIQASTTFSLSCSGSGGNTVQMVSVSALGDISVSWVAPTTNVDGSPVAELAGYWIYYGLESRNYLGSVEVNDPSATSHTFSAASGDYFVTITAIDRDLNESPFANEIRRSVP